MSNDNNIIDASGKFANVEERKPKKEKQIKAKPPGDKEYKSSSKNQLIDAIAYLNKHYEFRFNEITKWAESKTKSGYNRIEQRDFDNLIIELELNNCAVAKDKFGSLLGSKFISESYNPISDFINSLPRWDGIDRIPDFLSRITLLDESQRELFEWAFKKWFVAFVASVLDDAVINHTALVFVSYEHGLGKTTFFNNLIPPSLYTDFYHVGSWDPRNKDHIEYLGTKWLLNMDDLDILNKVELGLLKSAMTVPKVEVRRPYGRASIRLPRMASFCGSTNEKEFLSDSENRRWLPFEVDKIDNTKSVLWGGLYSQAISMYNQGFQYWFDRDGHKRINQHTEQFRRINQEEEMIMVNYRIPTELDYKMGNVQYKFTTDIMHELASSELYRKYNVNNSTARAFGRALHKLGFKKPSMRGINGISDPRQVWAVVKLRAEDADLVRKGKYSLPEIINNDTFF